MKKITTTILTVLFITLFSCSEVTGEFKYMDELKKSISEKYETEKVEINIRNNDELIVSLVDPKFDDFNTDRKEQIAQEIGKLAQELREDKEKLKSGVLKFRDEANYGIAKASSTETFQMYE